MPCRTLHPDKDGVVQSRHIFPQLGKKGLWIFRQPAFAFGLDAKPV
jgi:hypothetical protein